MPWRFRIHRPEMRRETWKARRNPPRKHGRLLASLRPLVIDLLQRIRAHATRNAQAVAIVRRESDGSYAQTTFGDLVSEADAFARAFATHAARARIIPILAGKSATSVAALLGAVASGHAAACLNP